MIQDALIKGSFDLTLVGEFVDVELKLFVVASKQTIATARWVDPLEDEYQITNVGKIFSFDFEHISSNLLGDYGLELNLLDVDGEKIKNGQGIGINITQKAS